MKYEQMGKNLYLQMRLKNKIKIRYYSVLINCQFNVNLDIPFIGMMLSCIQSISVRAVDIKVNQLRLLRRRMLLKILFYDRY